MTSRITCCRSWAGSRLCQTAVSCLAVIAVIISLFVVGESSPLRGATSNNSVLRRNRQQSSRTTATTPTTTTTTTTTSTPIAAEDELHDYDQRIICPQFTCPALPESCVLAEFMVFVYEYRVPRRPSTSGSSRGEVTVNVHCETCQYCVDTPRVPLSSLDTEAGNRRRRNVDHIERSRDKCEAVGAKCPTSSTDCTDVRMLDVIIDGMLCDLKCSACYDSLIFQRMSGRFLLSSSANDVGGRSDIE